MERNGRTVTEKYLNYQQDLNRRLSSKSERVKTRAAYEQNLFKNSKFIELNGTLHHYHDSGPKDSPHVIVLIHGWDCWWMWWHIVIQHLNENGIRTIAYDLKGHGWSAEDAHQDYSLPSFSHDLHALVEALGLKQYHIAAFSLGPFIALDYATRFKTDIQTLTFFNFGYFPNNAFLTWFVPRFVPTVFDKVLRKIKWWPPVYLYARMTLMKNSIHKEDIIIGVNSLRFISSQAIRQTATQITQIEVTENIPKQVSQIDRPILFVAGKGDNVVSWKNTEKLFRYAKNGRLEVIKKCGHLITVELPEVTSELIMSNINGQSRSNLGSEYAASPAV
jgi:pimeloyl-ACP methyl ester carboxylesterase